MHLFGLIIISIGVTAVKTEVDCSQHPPPLKLENCCELSNLISDEMEEKCASQDFHKEHPHPHHGHPPGPPDHPPGSPRVHGGPHKFGPHKHCFLSCVVNETGILVDGELQEDALNQYLDKLFGDNDKVEFLSSKFKSCHESEHRSGMLLGCVHKQAFKDCPDSLWSNTDECNELRNHFNQCWPPSKNQDIENGEAEVEDI